MYELDCRFDKRKSFYGKAKVVIQQMSDWKEVDLYSYDTLVAKIILSGDTEKFICYGKWSQTTTRHQREFFKQNGLNDKQIEYLFKNGSLEVEI